MTIALFNQVKKAIGRPAANPTPLRGQDLVRAVEQNQELMDMTMQSLHDLDNGDKGATLDELRRQRDVT